MRSWQSYIANQMIRLRLKRRRNPDLPIHVERDRIARIDARLVKTAPEVKTEVVDSAGVPSEWVTVGGAKQAAVILYLHGGAFAFRTPNTHRALLVRLCREIGAKGLMPDYRLAPEHPFPAGLEDCIAVYRRLLNQHAPENIMVAGDSAGGCFALALLQTLRDSGEPLPTCAVLLSPVTDMTLGGASIIRNEKQDHLFRLQSLLFYRNAYLQDASPVDPKASPLWGAFNDLPPLLFQVGSGELLLDDSTRAAEKARMAGVDVQIEIWDGMVHVFQALGPLPESRQAIRNIGRFARPRINH